MKLLLIRHGQTDWNRAQRFQGQSDIPLNDAGQYQASALARRLSSQPFDVVYASDLGRALETANILAAGKKEVMPDARLREINFGTWEGLTYDEIKQKYSDTLATWENDVYQNAPPNGETVEQLAKRVQSALNDFHERHKEQTLLIVAHGGVLQSLICLALKLSPIMYWQFHISPASLSEVTFYPAGAILNLLNDTSHLACGTRKGES
jgi:alpha-ribazole phosphatase